MTNEQQATPAEVRAIIATAWQQHGKASAILPCTPRAKPAVTAGGSDRQIQHRPEADNEHR